MTELSFMIGSFSSRERIDRKHFQQERLLSKQRGTHTGLFMESSLLSVKATLALKNLTRKNLRLARAQFARRECIRTGVVFLARRAEKEGKNGKKGKEESERVKRIDRKYSGGIKINSVPGNVCGR